MKKIDFEKLSNNELFGNLQSKKIDPLTSSNLRAGDGTSTALCKTSETSSDRDTQTTQENLGDKRCSGY